MSWFVVHPKTVLLLLSCIVFFGVGWRTATAAIGMSRGGAGDIICEGYWSAGNKPAWQKCVKDFEKELKCGETNEDKSSGTKFCNPQYNSCKKHCNNVVDESGKIVACCAGGPQEKQQCKDGVGKMVNGKYSCDIASGPPKDTPPANTPAPGPNGTLPKGGTPGQQTPPGSGGEQPKTQGGQGGGGGGGLPSLPSLAKSFADKLSEMFSPKQSSDAEAAFNRSGTPMATFTGPMESSSISDDSNDDAEAAFNRSGAFMQTFTGPVESFSIPADPNGPENSSIATEPDGPYEPYDYRNAIVDPNYRSNEYPTQDEGSSDYTPPHYLNEPDYRNAIVDPNYRSDGESLQPDGHTTSMPSNQLAPSEGLFGGFSDGPSVYALPDAERQQLQQMTFWETLWSGNSIVDWYIANYPPNY